MTYTIVVNEKKAIMISDVESVEVHTKGFNEHVKFLGKKRKVLALYRLGSIEGFYKEVWN